ncbi:hypothetical protein AC579_2830 [Pseudocercospora musae]|uniref:Uncharacterized protein n=1 Tax=Pseudocercospora musae TaxID=113226 RepID=A0A139IKM1_9PEZI|nr:hypothetical protein AC579_2830 [Pseudocercospora musae]
MYPTMNKNISRFTAQTDGKQYRNVNWTQPSALPRPVLCAFCEPKASSHARPAILPPGLQETQMTGIARPSKGPGWTGAGTEGVSTKSRKRSV